MHQAASPNLFVSVHLRFREPPQIHNDSPAPDSPEKTARRALLRLHSHLRGSTGIDAHRGETALKAMTPHGPGGAHGARGARAARRDV